MTVSRKPTIVALNESDQALQIAISELGRYAEDTTVLQLLRVLIEGKMERGGGEPMAVARAAIDEVVLSTGGRIRPMLLN